MERESKTSSGQPSSTTSEVDVLAQRWLERRETGLNARERAELRGWLMVPQHAAAFARADSARTELDWPLHAGTLDAVLDELDLRARKRRRRRQTVASVASVAALALGLMWSAWPRRPAISPTPANSSTLLVSQAPRQTMADGSEIDYNGVADFKSIVTATERRVELSRGTAYFHVTKDPRPFVVHARGVTAKALGTVFAVEIAEGNVSVLVTEGRVAVDRETVATQARSAVDRTTVPLATVDAGHVVSVPVGRATITPPPVAEISAQDAQERLAWRIPRLEFNATPLCEVIAMVNRHNRQQFVVEDRAVQLLAVSGILRADKIDALRQLLEADLHLRVQAIDGKWIVTKAE